MRVLSASDVRKDIDRRLGGGGGSFVRNLVPLLEIADEAVYAEVDPSSDICRVFDYVVEDGTAFLYYPTIADLVAAEHSLLTDDGLRRTHDDGEPELTVVDNLVAATRHPELFHVGADNPPHMHTEARTCYYPHLPNHNEITDADWPDFWLPLTREAP